MPPHQTRGHWSKSSHLVESWPIQTNSWSSSSAVCSQGSDLPSWAKKTKQNRYSETRCQLPVTILRKQTIQTLKMTSRYGLIQIQADSFPLSSVSMNVFIWGIHSQIIVLKPPLPASKNMFDSYTHISVKLQPVLMYSNQVTTPVWEHHALHMLQAQIFSLLFRPLPPLL